MGSSYSSPFYLKEKQLLCISCANPFLEQYFISIKNYQGYITSDIFYSKIITKAVDRKISNKIFKLFSNKETMSYTQLKNYFCALYSMNNKHKIEFIAYLIFGIKQNIYLKRYCKRVKCFFFQSLFLKTILLDNKLIDELLVDKVIDKEAFINLVTQKHIEKFNNFYFLKQYSTYENKANEEFEYICCCDNKYEGKDNKQMQLDSKPLYNQMYNQFESSKNNNGGFYSISILQRYLLDVHVNELLVNCIVGYIQRKTMKNFIDYELFYSLIINLPPSLNQKCLEYLFNILSYPNDAINKNTLIEIIQSIQLSNSTNVNSNGNSNGTDSIIKANDSNKPANINIIAKEMPDTIIKEQFIAYGEKSQIEGIDGLKNNIDRISYIPYIFFNIKPNQLAIEYACIQNIMGGKTISQYIKEQLLSQDAFYAIPYLFWLNYTVYLSSLGELTNRPTINTKVLSSDINPSLLNPNAIYLQDYCVLPSNLYSFIIRQCPRINGEIKLKKISYPKKDNANSMGSIPELAIEKDNIVTELEIIPITVIHFSIDFIIISLDNPNIDKAKEFLNSMSLLKGNNNCKLYSRTTILSEVKKELMLMYEYQHWESSDIIIYYEKDFIKIPNDKVNTMTFDSININDMCLCLLNTKQGKSNMTCFDMINNNSYAEIQSNNNNNKEKCINDKKEVKPQSSQSHSFSMVNYLGIENLQNICYINSVIQILYSIPTLHTYLKSKYFQLFINSKTSEDKERMIIYQLYKIMNYHYSRIIDKELYKRNLPVTIEPISLIKCIEAISPFKRDTQEDAGEFLLYLINELHQEMKMIDNQKQTTITNYEYNDKLSDEDNVIMIWGKEILHNTSIINSLFLFLNQSTLKCNKCGGENRKCQASNNLFLPIPKDENIELTIILHRLPYKFKVCDNNNDNNDNKEAHLVNKELMPNDLSLDNSIETNSKAHKDNKIDSKNTDCIKDELYLSPLSRTIPIKLSLIMKQRDKCSRLITQLRSNTDLDLEQCKDLNSSEINNNDLHNTLKTTFILYHDQFNVFLNINKEIGANCSNGDTLHIYELLNANGINSHKEIPNQLALSLYNTSTIILNSQSIKIVSYNTQNTLSNEKIIADALYPVNDTQKVIYIEYLIEIKHRYPKTSYPYLFYNINFYSLGFMPDYLLVNNSQANITASSLYKYIWGKYSYVLPSSSKTLLWWDNDSNSDSSNNKSKVQSCYPFVLKIIDTNKGTCHICPWFKLCKGCRIKASNEVLFIPPKASIVVEWCSELIKSGEIFTNSTLTLPYEKDSQHKMESQPLSLSLTQSQLQENKPNESHELKAKQSKSISIDQCFDLYFQQETIDDPIQCKICQTKTEHTKHDKLLRLPKYLLLTLKRFNQMDYASNIKNNTLIDFPLKDLIISGKAYDLYGVIYHTGNSNIGHYYTVIKGTEGKWVSLNDKRVTLIEDERKIKTNQAYILIYEENNKCESSLYGTLIKTIMNNWESNQYDCFVFEGEPVGANGTFGVVKSSFFDKGEYLVKVLFDTGTLDINIKHVKGFIEYHTKKIWNKESQKEKPGQYQENDSGCIIY